MNVHEHTYTHTSRGYHIFMGRKAKAEGNAHPWAADQEYGVALNI